MDIYVNVFVLTIIWRKYHERRIERSPIRIRRNRILTIILYSATPCSIMVGYPECEYRSELHRDSVSY
jgi:hypothetical protein